MISFVGVVLFIAIFIILVVIFYKKGDTSDLEAQVALPRYHSLSRLKHKIQILPPLPDHVIILRNARNEALLNIVESSRSHLKNHHDDNDNLSLNLDNISNINQPIILIVDDSKSALLVAERAIRKGPYRIITAHNGLEALNQVYQHNPDLILTDVEMPEMDGFSLVKRLKKDTRYSDIPIIMMTGNVQLHIAVGAQEGINGFVAKPYKNEDLLQQIEYLLS